MRSISPMSAERRPLRPLAVARAASVLVAACAAWSVAALAGGAARAQDVPAPGADTFDPFAAAPARTAATAEAGTARKPGVLPLLKSLDLQYQGKYVPDLINASGKDQLRHDGFADAALGWDVGADAALEARVVANYERARLGAASSHASDITALEYYYRRQFGAGAQALTVGRKVMDWSSGFQWRPANVIDNGYSSKDIDIADPYRYRGVNQVRYELVRNGFDAVAIASNDQHAFYGGRQFAAKIGVTGSVDLALLAAVNGSYARKYGVVLGTLLPWGTTFALEAVHVEIKRAMLADAAHFGKTLESLSGRRRYQDVYLSLTKFIDDRRRVSVEYFHNGRGLDAMAARGPGAVTGSGTGSGADARAIDQSLFSRQYLGRDYVYVAATNYIDAWQLQFKPSVMLNTGDNSRLVSFSLKRELGESSELTLNFNTFHGRAGSEFGSVTKGVGVGVSYLYHFY